MKAKNIAIIILGIAIIAAIVYFRKWIMLKLGYIGKSTTEKVSGSPVDKDFTEIENNKVVDTGYIGIYQYQAYEANLNGTVLNNLIKGQLSDLSSAGIDVSYARITWNQTSFGTIRDIALGIVVKINSSTSAEQLYSKLGSIGWLKEAIIGQAYMQPYKAYYANP